MYDAHMHLDFMSNGEEVAAAACEAGMRLFAGTVTPDGYLAARERFAEFPNVDLGLGLHPWWVQGDGADVERFLGLLPGTCFVSEVGLDFGKRHAETRDAQLRAFSRIAAACAREGGKVLSIHSVHAAREVLDILETAGALETCTCIFHWYSGPSDQLKRAIQAGCLFSVNACMLATRRGPEYVKAIPADRILTETDAPPEQGAPYPFEALRDELASTESAIIALKPTWPSARRESLSPRETGFLRGK